MRLIDADEIIYDCDYDNGNGCDKICHCDNCNNHVVKESIIKNLSTINAIPIPENITNGDMIKLLFPNKYGEEYGRTKVYYCIDAHNRMEFQIDWWNKPYKEEK